MWEAEKNHASKEWDGTRLRIQELEGQLSAAQKQLQNVTSHADEAEARVQISNKSFMEAQERLAQREHD